MVTFGKSYKKMSKTYHLKILFPGKPWVFHIFFHVFPKVIPLISHILSPYFDMKSTMFIPVHPPFLTISPWEFPPPPSVATLNNAPRPPRHTSRRSFCTSSLSLCRRSSAWCNCACNASAMTRTWSDWIPSGRLT